MDGIYELRMAKLVDGLVGQMRFVVGVLAQSLWMQVTIPLLVNHILFGDLD